uniref:BTB domain-containing protein n=1 Tax=Panagrellus redivivus TaxID=6233 RepID=A0A7E4W965_PANRE
MCDQNYGDNLYSSPTDSDVMLVVEDDEFPAHRSILSKRSEYFKAMFSSSFIEANSDKIVLKDTNLNAFKRVLKYIYTNNVECLCDDSISIYEAFELLLCSRFYMVDSAASAIIRYIEKKGVHHSFLVLSNALAYDIDELVSHGTYLVKNHKLNNIKSKVFDQLSPLAVDYLLNHDSSATVSSIFKALVYWLQCNPSYFSTFIKWFKQLSPLAAEHFLKLCLITPESKIFEVLVHWMRDNSKFASTFCRLLEHIELHLLDKVQLDMLFEPTQLVDRKFFNNLLCQQQEQANVVQKLVERNVINGIDDLRIVHGSKFTNEKMTHLNGIVIIDLKKQFLLNCFIMNMISNVCCTISVSKDMRDWERVIDRSKYECFGPQVFYFYERAVRFFFGYFSLFRK